MTDRLNAILAFRQAADQPIRQRPTLDIPHDEKVLALDLIREELEELAEAIGYTLASEYDGSVYFRQVSGAEPDAVATADAIGDLLVVCEQLGPTFGMNTDAIFTEVHASNMSKVDPATGKMPKKPNGKAGKGPNFWEPNLGRVLAESSIEIPDERGAPDVNDGTDIVVAQSATQAHTAIAVDFPALAQLPVVSAATYSRTLAHRPVRHVFALPNTFDGPGGAEFENAVRSAIDSSDLDGRVFDLVR